MGQYIRDDGGNGLGAFEGLLSAEPDPGTNLADLGTPMVWIPRRALMRRGIE